jgi:hypothetical protein
MNSGGFLVSQGETGDEREMGFINAFELNSGIQQQIFHSDSQSCWNERVFCLEEKSAVELENESVRYVIRSGF